MGGISLVDSPEFDFDFLALLLGCISLRLKVHGYGRDGKDIAFPGRR